MLWFPQLQYQSPGIQLLSRFCPQRPCRPAQSPRRLKFKFPQTLQIQSPGLAGPRDAASFAYTPGATDAAARGGFHGGTDSMDSFAYTPGTTDGAARGRFRGGTDSMDSSDPMRSAAWVEGRGASDPSPKEGLRTA